MNDQRFSPHKYTFDEIVEAMTDPVVHHFYLGKMQYESKCNKQVLKWIFYANMTGKYQILKNKYPIPFNCEKTFGIK